MPSREFRRAMHRKEENKENVVEKKRTQHPVIYALSVVILVVIVVTFVFTGTGRGMRGGGSKIEFGRYRGKPVEYYANSYFDQQVNDINSRLGKSADEDIEAKRYYVFRYAFDQTVAHVAYLAEAERSGAWVSEDRVDQALIRSGPWTYGGVFNEERYRAASNPDKYAYRKLFREQLLAEQFQRDVALDPRISSQEVEFFKAMAGPQRRFSLVSYPFGDYPDAEVKAYGEKNIDRFRRIKLSQILIKSSENEAREIRRKLDDRSASFEDLARAHSKDSYADKGGDAGWRYAYDLESDFEDKTPLEDVLALPEGALSPVLKSRFGWLIYRCDSPALRPDLNDAETLKVVRTYVGRYEKGQVEDYFLKQAEAFRQRAKEVGFVGAALSLNVKTHQTEFFPLTYQGLFGPVQAVGGDPDLSSATNSEEFFLKTFRLAPGELSEALLLEDRVVVLKLDELRETPQEQLDQIALALPQFVQSTRQADVQEALLKPEYIQDDFQKTYSSIFGTQQTALEP